jgi:protein-tyrosine phosphatase
MDEAYTRQVTSPTPADSTATAPIRVLFVCLGNICRSPAAEAAFLHLVAEAGRNREFVVDSAGTGAWHIGERADVRMRQAAVRRGIKIRSVARQVRRTDFEDFDWILAMDASSLETLHRMAPTARHARVRLFRDLDPDGRGRDVPDPYYGDLNGFDEVLDIVTRTARALLAELTQPAR